MRLDNLKHGQECKIRKNHSKGKLMHKLLDMGFVNNAKIKIIREAPLYDPMELKIQNYLVSIRKSEAKMIEVEIV